jgi:hypothetical protein
MPPAVGRVALGWAAFLVVASGILLLTLTPGTPEFVITLFTLCIGLFLGLIVVVAALLMRRGAEGEDDTQ